MTSEIEIFDPENQKVSFDDFCVEDGEVRYWSARWLMKCLGYADYNSFQRALSKGQQVCLTLELPLEDNFKPSFLLDGEKKLSDFQLSRFACYLVVMHADPRKPNVAKAQAFFAASVQEFQQSLRDADEIERITIREDLSDHDKSLSSTAKAHGVENYAFFLNKGYLGMYNMPLDRLKRMRSIPNGRPPLDFMGKEELAANLFRVTQTEAKIRNDKIRGQNRLESAAYDVGQKVRQTMIELSGDRPEALPKAEDIRKVRSELKQTHKGLKKIDKSKK